MGKQKQKEENIWRQRKITLLYLIVLVVVIMVMIMAVRSIVSYVESNDAFSSEEEDEKYDYMHNASRFFFRVYFPEHWNVDAESNGFWLSEEEHLVLELYPMVRVLHTADPAATSTPTPEASQSPEGDRLAGMVRDSSLTARFYYYSYTEEQKNWILANPSETPTLTEDLTEPVNKTDLKLLEKIAGDVYSEMTGAFDPAVYTWDEEIQLYKTTDIAFRYFTYQYLEEGVAHTADVYVTVRASNYYVIIYDGISTEEENGYRNHHKEFQSILEEFRFSVFEN